VGLRGIGKRRRWAEVQVREIMTKEPACCTPDSKLQEVARLMVEHDCGAVPVVESRRSKKPVGVITDRDITCRAVRSSGLLPAATAGELMTTPVTTVTPGVDLDECVRLMEERQVRRVPVVDEKGHCCGIVAQADVARRASEHETAELVRDISLAAPAP
jgi:CBS domain-containing protein